MNDCCQVTVYEAEDGQQVLAGHAYIAPGDRHLMVVRDGARYVCKLDDGVPVNRHKPSVDVLFRSVAQNAGRNAIGVLLTGMGKDGARGPEGDAGRRAAARSRRTRPPASSGECPGKPSPWGPRSTSWPLENVAGRYSLWRMRWTSRAARERREARYGT